MLPTEYILTMGYFPDRFAEHRVPPDVFFNHVSLGPELAPLFGEAQVWKPSDGRVASYEASLDYYWILLEDSVESLRESCIEKYKLTALPHEDTFWSCSTRPAAEAPTLG